MGAKITIVEGNSNDKDNVRNYMVKGEKGADGVSPSASVTRGTNSATVTVTDAEGTTSSVINDGFSPTVTAEKVDKTTTITITDINGTETAEIKDGVDLTGGVPTNGVIGFDGDAEDVPNGYEVTSNIFPQISNDYSTSITDSYSCDYVNDELSEIIKKTNTIKTFDNSLNSSLQNYQFTMTSKGSALIIINNTLALIYFGIDTQLGRNVLLSQSNIVGTVATNDNNNGILTIGVPAYSKMLMITY